MKLGRVALVAAAVLLLDQLTKWWMMAALEPGYLPLIGKYLGLRLVFNSGAALSIGAGYTWVLTGLAVVVSVVIVRTSQRVTSRLWLVIAGLVLGGALGNLADRLFRPPGFARGHVVDFIDYGGFFVGNVADIAIVVGAVLVAWATWRGIEPWAQQTSDNSPALATQTEATATATDGDGGGGLTAAQRCERAADTKTAQEDLPDVSGPVSPGNDAGKSSA